MNKFSSCILALLQAGALCQPGSSVASAQTETDRIPSTVSGPCTARFRHGVHGLEWVISVNDEPIFTEDDLGLPPFTRSGYGKPTVSQDAFHPKPVFGCTTTTIYLESFQGTVATVAKKNFLVDTDWELAFTSLTGFLYDEGSTFQAPDVPLASVHFLNATAFLSQGDRLAMLGNFSTGSRKTSRAYDLTNGKSHLFNFGFDGLESSSIGSACITGKALWFAVSVGSFQEVFQINAAGNLVLIAALNGGEIGFTCTEGGAEFGMQMPRGSLMRRSVPDR